MCDCVEEVNEMLEKTGRGGTELALTMTFDGSPRKPMLEVGRRGQPWKKPLQGNPKFVVPTFCPFCGEKYPGPEAP